jgi:hypothetical protein
LDQPQGARPRGSYEPGLALVQCAFLLLLAPHLGFVPLWDSSEYVEHCLLPAIRDLRPFELNCFGHPSMGYMGILAVPQLLFGPSATVLNLTNALLGIASIWGVFAILRAVYPECPPRDRCLLTALYAFWPAVAASCLNMSPDFGVLVFSVVTVAFLVQNDMARAAIAGLFLVFSKESGVLLYGLAVAAYVLLLLRETRETPGAPRRARASPWLLAVPLAAFGLFAASRTLVRRPVIFAAPVEKGHLSLDPRTVIAGVYAPAMWILNGGWVLPLTFVLAPIVALLFPGPRRRWEKLGIGKNRRTLFLAVLLLGSAYGLTRYETFMNVRYLLPIYPFLIALWFLPVTVLTGESRARSVFLALCLAWIAAGVYRTTDPVSKGVWGTFDFGNHKILSLTSLTGECCGFGRDQLPYNLEFLKFGEIQGDIFAWIRPEIATALVANRRADRTGRVTPDGRRTLRLDDTLTIRFVTPENIEKRLRRPETVYFFAFPNFSNAADLDRLQQSYRIESIRRFRRQGYEIPVYVLRAKKVQALS